MESAALGISSTLIFFFSTSVCGCGRVADYALTSLPSDARGISDKYPWHAALYRTGEGWNPNYAICGATLIDHNKVITVAHCVADRVGKLINENQLTVILGKVRSKWNTTDKYQQKYQVSKLIIHQDYSGTANNYMFDIAVLVLKENVTINDHVGPACLDLETLTEEIHNGTLLHTAGWGYDEETGVKRNKLREVALSYIDHNSCKDISELFKPYVTTDKFCVLPISESKSLERVDSGHGITIEKKGQYFLLGLIAIQQTDGKLRSNTAVSSYTSWIKDIINKY